MKRKRKLENIGDIARDGAIFLTVNSMDDIVSDPMFLGFFRETYSNADLSDMPDERLLTLLRGKIAEWIVFLRGGALLETARLAESATDPIGDIYVGDTPVQVKAYVKSGPDLEGKVLKGFLEKHPNAYVAGTEEGVARAIELGVPRDKIYATFSREEIKKKCDKFLRQIKEGNARYGISIEDFAYSYQIGQGIGIAFSGGFYLIEVVSRKRKFDMNELSTAICIGGLRGGLTALKNAAIKALFTSPRIRLPPLAKFPLGAIVYFAAEYGIEKFVNYLTKRDERAGFWSYMFNKYRGLSPEEIKEEVRKELKLLDEVHSRYPISAAALEKDEEFRKLVEEMRESLARKETVSNVGEIEKLDIEKMSLEELARKIRESFAKKSRKK